MVALVAFLIASSVAEVPSQWAEINPVLIDNTD